MRVHHQVFWALIAMLSSALGLFLTWAFRSDSHEAWVIGPALIACSVGALSFAIEHGGNHD